MPISVCNINLINKKCTCNCVYIYIYIALHETHPNIYIYIYIYSFFFSVPFYPILIWYPKSTGSLRNFVHPLTEREMGRGRGRVELKRIENKIDRPV
jgi:hypothetical protein